MYVQTDSKQLIEEVKERNRFYKALQEIREIALESSSTQESNKQRDGFLKIIAKCDNALKNET